MKLPANTHTDIKALRILCIALMAGVVIFAGMVLELNYFDPMTTGSLEEYAGIALYILAGVAGIGFLIARRLFGRRMLLIKNASVNIPAKLNHYLTAFISYMALCEGPAIVAILLFMLTNNSWLLAIAGLLLWAMVVKFPGKQKADQ